MERHFVATGYVVRDGKTLLLYHKKLRMWLPPGGHIDEGELPEEAVRREVREETGLEVDILSPKRRPESNEKGVEYLYVPNHIQLEDIPGDPPREQHLGQLSSQAFARAPHQHIDLIYFCRARDGEAAISVHEHDAMRWYSLEDLRREPLREEVRQTAAAAIQYVQGK